LNEATAQGAAKARFVIAALLGGALLSAALWPLVDAHRAARRAAARLDDLAARAGSGCLALDEALTLRVQKLGPLLASWETVGGCGAGGGASVGTGVKWIGHGTTGGLFQVFQQGNYTKFTDGQNLSTGAVGYQYTSATQISKELTDKWTMGLSIPLIYKYYYDPRQLGFDLSNSGLGDISGMLTRRFGRINDTSVTAIVGFPTGSYKATYQGSMLVPDQQLGFGKFTGTLLVDHTIDETWGLIVVGGAAGYRGGRNDVPNYRAPGGSLYSYVGYFLGPLVPVLGVTFTGYTQQDTRGDFGETINSPVATVAGNASLEWSNDYVAVLLGAQFPYAVRGRNWGEGPQGVGRTFGWQPWTLALGISVSPF
jgi:hypothetical protein